MTVQRRTSALASIARLEALQVSRVMAAARLGIGAVGLLAPGRLAWRLFVHGRRVEEPTVLVLRAAAGRDLALGLGTALASKRAPASLRGWLLAAALVDCCDALAIAKNKSSSAAVRTVTALISGLSAGTEMLLAWRLRR
jgi:Na+/H+ antiporter NhaA